MACDESVVYALVRLGKAGDASELPQRTELLTPPGEQLMDVTLMPHVENEPVARRVEHAMDGDRQLDCAEVGRKVSAGA